MRLTRPGKAHAGAALKFLLFALLSVHFAYNQLKTNLIFLDTYKYISGLERAPYQYRVLMMPVFSSLLHFMDHLNPRALDFTRPGFMHSTEQLAYFFVATLCYGVSLYLFDLVSRRLFPRRPAMLCLLTYIIITYVYFDLNPILSFLLPYDMSTLIFSNALLLLFLDRRWISLCLLFVAATVNRETSFFMIFVVLANAAVTSDPVDRTNSLRASGAMTAAWLVVKVVLTLLIRHVRPDEGTIHGIINIRVPYNLLVLVKPWYWPAIVGVYAPPLMAAYLLAKSKQAEVRVWAVGGLASFLAFFVLANTTEQRAFGDLVGVYAIICTFFVLRTVLSSPDADPAAPSAAGA